MARMRGWSVINVLETSSNAVQAKTTDNSSIEWRIASLRRPKTRSSTDFWFVTQQRWDELVSEARDSTNKPKAKVALNSLSKFDAAGRIVETNEGVVASRRCSWCARPGTLHDCMVFAQTGEGEKVTCAYCKRMGKSGCTATHPNQPSRPVATLSVEDRLAALEARIDVEAKLAALEARVETLEWRTATVPGISPDDPIAALEARVQALEDADAARSSVRKMETG